MISCACCAGRRSEANVVRNHQGTANLGIVSLPIWLMEPKQVFMLVEKNTFGQCPVWTSAPTSVPTAPASSGCTCIHDPAAKPDFEITLPACRACALLCT